MSLLNFMKEAESQSAEEQPEKVAQEAEVTSAEQEKQVEAEATSEESPDEQSEEPVASGEGGWLRNWLAKAGYDPDELSELDDDEIERQALDRLRGGAEQPTPATDGKVAQPATDGAQVAPPSPAPEKESKEQEKAQAELEKLEYDRRIAELVRLENGKYLPIDETPEAIEAAKVANAYTTKRRERLEKIVDDPRGTLEPLFDELIEKRLQERFEAFQKQQEEAQARLALERQRMSEEQRLQSIIEENKSLLYKLDDEGQIQRSLKTNKLKFTPFGREVERQFLELAELSPEQNQSVLLQKAIRDVSRYMKPEQAEEVAPKAAPASPAEKKKEFLEKAKAATVDTEVSKKPASVQETVELGAGTTLLDAIVSNPDTQDNPAVQAIRNRMAR